MKKVYDHGYIVTVQSHMRGRQDGRKRRVRCRRPGANDLSHNDVEIQGLIGVINLRHVHIVGWEDESWKL